MRAQLMLLFLAVAASGCARPEEVRSVASDALPIATQLEVSAPLLQKRLALQRRYFDLGATNIAHELALYSEAVALYEREWKLRNDGDRLRRLATMRDRDERILANPLAPLTPISGTTTADIPLATKDLKSVIEALSHLKGAKQTDAKELLGFAKSVREELEKIEKEAATKQP